LIAEQKNLACAEYVERLNHAGTDNVVFEPVVAGLAADKSINKDDMDVIAHNYTLGRRKWKNRKAALDAIRDRFNERAYHASKMKIVERYKVG
jgi:hypothetical protein